MQKELQCVVTRKEESQNNLEIVKPESCMPKKSTRRTARISSSSSDVDSNKSNNIGSRRKKRSFNKENADLSIYTKQYVCRFCSSRWSKVNLVLYHIYRKHSRICKKYEYIFKRHCQVTLHRTDLEQNETFDCNNIVHSKEKIVRNVKANYFIMYTTRNRKENNKSTFTYEDGPKINRARIGKSKYHFSSDSSDDEVVVKRKRRSRFCSRSSNETVCLDNKSDNDKYTRNCKNNYQPAEIDTCINLDDSSETDSVISSKIISEKQTYDITIDQSIINEMINFCGNKYLKKQEDAMVKSTRNSSDTATHLKRKILSIGRKIINKKVSVNCTPLLRFLEQKSLDISWLPREVVYVNQDSNYIRILPRIKHIGEKFDFDTGWTDYSIVHSYDRQQLPLVASTSSNDDAPVQGQTEVNSIGIQQNSSELAGMLEANQIIIDTKKLLNTNPVANPKQLPKKTITIEMKSSQKPAENALENNEDLCMPIIASATSLAIPVVIDNIMSNPKTGVKKPEAPRIKVKPVSELMSAETLNRMQSPIQMPFVVSQALSVQNTNNVINVIIPRVTAGPPHSMIQTNNSMGLVATEPAWQNEFMILDTVEFPNTRTNSPFMYFRNLLQIHNIILLDTHAEINGNFHCLIKFKVLYKQDNKNQPVILCLSLFCANNIFCFKVKDRNQDIIDLVKISPNWQWEVLKIYKGEVVYKVLNNAQKISQNVYESTNKFMCLLKSINQVQAEVVL